MEKQTGAHRLTMEDGEQLTLSGVQEVLRFDDNLIILSTNHGPMTIRGEELKLKDLSLERGQVAVNGKISAIVYEQAGRGGSIFKRLLG